MSDLTERLREWHAEGFGDIFKEAADEIDRLCDGIQRVIDGTYGRDKYFETKHDTCPHGQFSWQSCDPCVDEYLASLLSPSDQGTPTQHRGTEA